MKKRNKRNWYIPVFEDGIKELQNSKQFPVGTLAFDDFNNAYSYAASLRLSPLRDEDGELVLDENGRAQLPPFGKVNIVEIEGRKIDWKNVEIISSLFHLKGMKETRDAIEFQYNFPFHNNSVKTIKEESDEFYDRTMIRKED